MEKEITVIIESIFVCVVLPVAVVFLVSYFKTKRVKSNNQVLIKLIEKNPSLEGADAVMRQMQGTHKAVRSVKSQVIEKFVRGVACLAVGSALVVDYFYLTQNSISAIVGVVLLAIGVAFVLSYFVMRSWYSREIADEETSKSEKQ